MTDSQNTILVVDDDDFVCRFVGAMVKRLGFEVATAVDCAKAKEQFEAHIPILIFLDIELGEEDGTEFCSWVRQQGNGNKIPVVMGSSHNEREYIVRSIKAGANDFIVKPYHALAVKKRIIKHLGKNSR